MYYSFFVSQHDQDYHPEVACGVASLSMLLRYHRLGDGLKFVDLAQQLRLTAPPAIKGYLANDPPIGVFPEDVYRFLFERKILFRVSFFKHEWEACLLGAPIMVLMRDDGEEFGPDGHWVVVVDKEGPTFTYLDPWYKEDSGEYVRKIEESVFFDCFTGCACQIIQQGTGFTKFIPADEEDGKL
ncbi:MAG: hypothetical protein E6230_20360 [Paenibacillus dendritiformis]|uniref:hypothetical protein n=1 Tax=Paenibacillus dendritiformis TaxID=130049 RepID=UPI00143DFD29|nr:hypothetical protein [Paenibacillus dendritiformis]MDU5144526.1 hypothetical protein [Paenibacillus dendritiformis]NKI24724.1 hypothetical protein [Paenibacillus dendritiformis]NRG00572.1 hypothetical protein [Paenibacillus dendritiformis]GIO71261.1 hypothetical protein J27TS7_07750 [Paenibacillus dendritiformis]